MKSLIAKKLIIYIVLFSSTITLMITAIQLFIEFQHDVSGINKRLEQIRTSYLESITQSAWVSDRQQLQTILDGITEMPDIVYAEVYTTDKKSIVSGSSVDKDKIEFKFDLNYSYNNRDINIGSFTAIASLTGVYSRLVNRLWIILLSNAFKTSLVALFIYFLFSRLVTRHLSKISDFSESHDHLNNTQKLFLDRNESEHDEFDVVVQSINNMHARLHEQVSEINQQKQYLSQTFNSIGDAVITTDSKGNVTRLNPVAEQLTGWKNNEAINQSVKTIFPIINASTHEKVENPIEKVLATGETIYLSNHTTLIAKNGKEYQIADSAAPIRDGDKILGMVLVFNDVTEQYRMREALHESEQRLRQLAENINEVFWLGSPDWNKVIYVSPAYEKNWGFSAENLYKNSHLWMDFIHPDDKQQVIDDIPKKLEDIKDCVEFREYRIVKADGKILWIKAKAYPVYDMNGDIIRIAGVAEDITTSKESNEMLIRSQKMDALGKLTSGIAHDYNNMLGVVLGYTELLQEELKDNPELSGYINEIMHAGERGSKLTKKLLTFSRNKPFSTIEKININSVLSDDRHMLEKTLTARIKLELTLAENLWPVGLDVNDLEDAILNLSINAMHAIEGSGQFNIATNNVVINSVEAVQLNLESGKYVTLSFIDTGCGMDETTREKIFDPFYSTKGDEGTGLGLSQVYGFMQRCGGAIKVSSALAQGSRFTLYFPCYISSEDKEINENKTKIISTSELEGNETILVVDDEVALQDIVSKILHKHGYHVLCADHAKQALQVLETEHVDLLLSDVIMPEMDGFELVEIVKEKYPNIKIQLVSGFTEKKQSSKIDESLVQNMLSKPYKASILLQRIKDLLS